MTIFVVMEGYEYDASHAVCAFELGGDAEAFETERSKVNGGQAVWIEEITLMQVSVAGKPLK